MIIAEMDGVLVGSFKCCQAHVSFSSPEHPGEKDPTYHFVLFAVPDGSTEQTLNLVAGVIWILVLSEQHNTNRIIPLREPEKEKLKLRDDTDCPGEALVLGDVRDVE